MGFRMYETGIKEYLAEFTRYQAKPGRVCEIRLR